VDALVRANCAQSSTGKGSGLHTQLNGFANRTSFEHSLRAMNWYYSEGDEQAGPVSQPEFESMVRAGKITPETQVWQEGMPAWKRFGEMAPATLATMVPGQSYQCAECGKTFPDSELIAFEHARVCASCKPLFVQKLKEGLVPNAQLKYAGFWIRFCARFIDVIILDIVNFGIGFGIGIAMAGGSSQKAAPLIAGLAGMILAFSYNIYFNGRYGATPGKMALKLKIVRSNGDPITYGRAFGRVFGEALSNLTLGIGYMMAGWDEQKRALHDRVCDTRVIEA
jgi:uncharacterized RDD family membrane protein YckC/DNA-directed RNA polymerase subunit RPC12/RpoP